MRVALAVVAILWAGAAAAQNTIAVPFTVSSASVGASVPAEPSICAGNICGIAVSSLPFSASGSCGCSGGGSFNGSITVSQPSNNLVSLRGDGTGSTSSTVDVVGPPVNAAMTISFTVPMFGDASMTDMLLTTSLAAGGAPEGAGRVVPLSQVSSAFFGGFMLDRSGVPDQTGNGIFVGDYPGFNALSTSYAYSMRLPAGDDVSIRLSAIQLGVRLQQADGTIGFDETLSFKLEALPEPSASLTVPSGVATLLALSKLRR